MSVVSQLRRGVYVVSRGALRLAGIAFPEAMRTPLDPQVTGQGSLPDFSLEAGWDRRYTVDRAQQLHRSNLLAGSLIDRAVEHVIGPGYRLRVMTKDAGFNRDARLMWEEWCNTPALCDVRARYTYREMQAQGFIGTMRDGDSAKVMRNDGRIRVVNSNEIAAPQGGYWHTTEADGVERDLDGKHVAYWIHEPDGVPYSNVRAAIHRLVRTPAEHVVFTARTPLGAQQTRGITAFLGTFQILEQIDGTLIALGTKAQVAAKLAMVITKKSPLPSTQFGGSGKTPITEIKNGTLTRLEPDEDIKPVQGLDPNANMIDLTKVMIRIVGTRWGLSLATVLLDHSDHNFSNARASSIETYNCTLQNQLMVSRSDSEIRNMKTIDWIRTGKLTARKRSTRELSLRHEWGFPARPLIDPLAERQADLLGLDMATTTLEEIASRSGKTARQIMRTRARERKFAEKLGLPDVRSSLTREENEMAPPDDSGKPTRAK